MRTHANAFCESLSTISSPTQFFRYVHTQILAQTNTHMHQTHIKHQRFRSLIHTPPLLYNNNGPPLCLLIPQSLLILLFELLKKTQRPLRERKPVSVPARRHTHTHIANRDTHINETVSHLRRRKTTAQLKNAGSKNNNHHSYGICRSPLFGRRRDVQMTFFSHAVPRWNAPVKCV